MGLFDDLQHDSSFSYASGNEYEYVVLQVTLKEKFFGTGSGNLTELEKKDREIEKLKLELERVKRAEEILKKNLEIREQLMRDSRKYNK